MSDQLPAAAVAATEAVLARLEPAAADALGVDPADLATRVSRLVAPLGPADQTALHDFHHVEFAFESVWTEVYDEDFAREVAKLYTTVGRVRRFAGYDADDPELVNWVDDLADQLDQFEAEAQEAESVEDPSYEIVLAVFPTMSPSLWAWIGPQERSRFLSFAIEYRKRPDPNAVPPDVPGPVEQVLGDAGGFVDDAVDWAVGASMTSADALFGWI